MLQTTHYPTTGTATPLLIAHGLFGSARNWNVIATRLADRGPLASVDMRNHGQSDWHDNHTYADLGDDLAQVIEAHWPQADVVGHSMGGKAAMMLALTQPGRVRRLIVADIAPVTYGHTQMHLIDAMRGVDLTGVTRRSDANDALSASIPDAGVRAFLLQSLDVKEQRWRFNLDALATNMDQILGFPEISGVFEGPTLFLSGADSDYVLPAHRAHIRTLFPNAKFAKIPGVGHWLHAEKPREFEAAVRVFLGD